GLATTVLRVPSFIVTLGTMLVIHGGIMWWTGGSATGDPAESFRSIGRGGIDGVPVLELIPYAVLILLAVVLIGVWVSRRPFGRTLVAIGDNPAAAAFAGAAVGRTETAAFVLSSLSATIDGILLVGYAGVHPWVGPGFQWTATAAVVLGGLALAGGRRSGLGAPIGALTPESPSTLLDSSSPPATRREAGQGAICMAAVASAGVVFARWARRR